MLILSAIFEMIYFRILTELKCPEFESGQRETNITINILTFRIYQRKLLGNIVYDRAFWRNLIHVAVPT